MNHERSRNRERHRKRSSSDSKGLSSRSQSMASYHKGRRRRNSYSNSSDSVDSAKYRQSSKKSSSPHRSKRKSYSRSRREIHRRSISGNRRGSGRKYSLDSYNKKIRESKRSHHNGNGDWSDSSLSSSVSIHRKRDRSYSRQYSDQKYSNRRKVESRYRSGHRINSYRRSSSSRKNVRRNYQNFRSHEDDSVYKRLKYEKSSLGYTSSSKKDRIDSRRKRSPYTHINDAPLRSKDISYSRYYTRNSNISRNDVRPYAKSYTRSNRMDLMSENYNKFTDNHPIHTESRYKLHSRRDWPNAYTKKNIVEVDRSVTCPFLLRVFFNMHKHHSLEDFNQFLLSVDQPESKVNVDSNYKETRIDSDDFNKNFAEDASMDKVTNFLSSELQLYTWKDTSLREIVDLVKDVCPEARNRSSKLSLKLLHLNDSGSYNLYDLGLLHNSRPGADDRRTLLRSKFEIGDIISIAIFPIVPRQTLINNIKSFPDSQISHSFNDADLNEINIIQNNSEDIKNVEFESTREINTNLAQDESFESNEIIENNLNEKVMCEENSIAIHQAA